MNKQSKESVVKKESLIHIENCQVKSAEKLEVICTALSKIEEEMGIREVRISFNNIFVCQDIDLTDFANSRMPMRRLVGEILIKIDQLKYGKKSKYVEYKHKYKWNNVVKVKRSR